MYCAFRTRRFFKGFMYVCHTLQHDTFAKNPELYRRVDGLGVCCAQRSPPPTVSPLWESEVVERRGVGSSRHRRLVTRAIDVVCRGPHFHGLPRQVQNLPCETFCSRKKRCTSIGKQLGRWGITCVRVATRLCDRDRLYRSRTASESKARAGACVERGDCEQSLLDSLHISFLYRFHKRKKTTIKQKTNQNIGVARPGEITPGWGRSLYKPGRMHRGRTPNHILRVSRIRGFPYTAKHRNKDRDA